MKAFILVLFMSWPVMASQFIVNGPIKPFDGEYHKPAPVQLVPSSKLKIGIEVGGGQFTQGQLGSISGAGFVGDYKLDPKWSIEGRLFFSEFKLVQPYYYSAWNGWRGDWNNWYNNYYSQYYLAQREEDFSNVEITSGPVYRLFRSKLSPTVGALIGYSHKYFSTPTASPYGNIQAQGSSDSLLLGAHVGLDYKIDKDISLGASVRYMEPLAASGIATYYPGCATSIDNIPYYITSLNLKFAF